MKTILVLVHIDVVDRDAVDRMDYSDYRRWLFGDSILTKSYLLNPERGIAYNIATIDDLCRDANDSDGSRCVLDLDTYWMGYIHLTDEQFDELWGFCA